LAERAGPGSFMLAPGGPGCKSAGPCHLYCTVWCTKLQKYFNAFMEVLYCFTVAIGLPGDASDYDEDKRSAVAARMRSKVVVE